MRSFISRNSLALIIFLGIGFYFLWTEHSAQFALAIPYLPFLLLLACPLLHVFMHGGHGHGGHGGDSTDGKGAHETAHPNGPATAETGGGPDGGGPP